MAGIPFVSSAISSFRPNVEARGNFVRTAWDRLGRVPGGSRVFSALVGRAAPYTATIGAHVEELRENFARVTLRDRPSVRNHLRCVHAVALVNLAELTGNVAVAYTLPDDARFIVAGLSIEYIKKARGTLTATSRPNVPRSSARAEHPVEVEIRDRSGELCAKATLRTLIGPKKADA